MEKHQKLVTEKFGKDPFFNKKTPFVIREDAFESRTSGQKIFYKYRRPQKTFNDNPVPHYADPFFLRQNNNNPNEFDKAFYQYLDNKKKGRMYAEDPKFGAGGSKQLETFLRNKEKGALHAEDPFFASGRAKDSKNYNKTLYEYLKEKQRHERRQAEEMAHKAKMKRITDRANNGVMNRKPVVYDAEKFSDRSRGGIPARAFDRSGPGMTFKER